MSIIAVATKHLIAAGLTGDALIAAIAEIEDATNELFASRTPVIEPLNARQERNRRYYEKRLNASEKRLKASETSESVLKVSPSLSPKEKSPPITPSKEITPISPTSKRPQAVDDVLTVRTILGACLTESSVDDLIEHRRRKKAPITARAAKELVKAFTEFGDPERAVALMILRGWTGFDQSWLDKQARAGPKIVARQKCFETSRPYMG